MMLFKLLGFSGLAGLLSSCCCQTDYQRPPPAFRSPAAKVQTFPVIGIVKQLQADGRTAIIEHQVISNYMAAMTMPFQAKDPAQWAGVHPGDEISFRLHVTGEESWIEQVSRTGRKAPLMIASNSTPTVAGSQLASGGHHPLLDYQFTNELGEAVSLSQFQGQALAITFFFTRCPIPDFCPRLSKNFEEASRKLAALPNAPTNWHFLSVSFDTDFDTPSILKAYAGNYHYNPAHWSFLTGAREKIGELARLSEVTIEPEGAFFNHSFRTLVIDAAGRLQMSFPIGGNLSDALVGELVKAAG